MVKKPKEVAPDNSAIVLADPILQAFRKQRTLSATVPSTKRLIRSPAKSRGIMPRESLEQCNFTQPGSYGRKLVTA